MSEYGCGVCPPARRGLPATGSSGPASPCPLGSAEGRGLPGRKVPWQPRLARRRRAQPRAAASLGAWTKGPPARTRVQAAVSPHASWAGPREPLPVSRSGSTCRPPAGAGQAVGRPHRPPHRPVRPAPSRHTVGTNGTGHDQPILARPHHTGPVTSPNRSQPTCAHPHRTTRTALVVRFGPTSSWGDGRQSHRPPQPRGYSMDKSWRS